MLEVIDTSADGDAGEPGGVDEVLAELVALDGKAAELLRVHTRFYEDWVPAGMDGWDEVDAHAIPAALEDFGRQAFDLIGHMRVLAERIPGPEQGFPGGWMARRIRPELPEEFWGPETGPAWRTRAEAERDEQLGPFIRDGSYEPFWSVLSLHALYSADMPRVIDQASWEHYGDLPTRAYLSRDGGTPRIPDRLLRQWARPRAAG